MTQPVLHLRLDGFEGPLDLLLELARAQKVDLQKISIIALVDQYLAVLEAARGLRLEIAADWLVMAAWLAWLKSRLLVPPEEAEGEDAEALAEQLSDHRVNAHSAGSNPKPIHPHAIRVAADRGLDLTTRRPKHLSTFENRRFDYVVSLCDRVRERCPEFPGAELVHWSIPDPSPHGLPAFERTAGELETRIRFLIRAIDWRHHA